ncbi:Calcium-dependent phosphotriesterase superfamily protein [Rhynchospora pubera]|uniref:Calcium-dependent phosphotriesterase superfamily protein n=1 Tax=Rhynchospora pubera TaxID=906938 RepID=A0AAV8ELQ5_9POAL|nr:Calcium-dependent phosphotriesterase superfamily protein [Rhynchospora pubera]KAJ4807267.1 Calcium-dependent phosphotriesterase superfamily protein [Rhynchospora pubera]
MRTKILLLIAVAAAIAAIFFSPILKDDHNLTIIESKDEDVEFISFEDGAVGPESITFDPNGGGPYTGVSDGRILKWEEKEHRWIEYASTSPPEFLEKCKGSKDPSKEHECGRPLGLKFSEKTGDLYIADAYHGLMVVHPGESVARVIAVEAGGIPFRFTNGVEIDQDNDIVYFTDSSTQYHRRDFMSTIISGDRTSRLMKYDPKTNQVEILLDNLSFLNGVLLSQNRSYLIFAETTNCNIFKYWLQGSKAKTIEVITELSGFPDNIKRSPRGGFWIGLHSKRTTLTKWALSFSWIRKQLLKLPSDQVLAVSSILNNIGKPALAVRLTEEGDIVEVLRGDAGKKIRHVSEIVERDGRLWFGSVVLPFLAVHHF